VEKGATPQEALLRALQAEENVLLTYEKQKISLPPPAHRFDPLPKVTRWITKYFPFFAKVFVGYLFVVCLTSMLLLIAFPSVQSRVETYILGGKAGTHSEKVLSKLGISLCLEK